MKDLQLEKETLETEKADFESTLRQLDDEYKGNPMTSKDADTKLLANARIKEISKTISKKDALIGPLEEDAQKFLSARVEVCLDVHAWSHPTR